MPLPSVTASGARSQSAVSPPGPAASVCVSSYTRSVPASVHSPRSPSWNPGSGSTTPTFVSAGSLSTQATSPRSRARSTAVRSLKGTTRVTAAPASGRPNLRGDPVEAAEQQLVGVAVVLAVEVEDDGPVCRRTADAQRLQVGLRGRDREAPLRPAQTRAQLGGDDASVLGRQQELATGGQPLGRGALNHRMCPAGEHAHVAEVEVAEAVAVEVGEGQALGVSDHGRRMPVDLAHPTHRDAGRQHTGAVAQPRERLAVALREELCLALLEPPRGRRVDAHTTTGSERISHGRQP
jgi:hypothetical protein